MAETKPAKQPDNHSLNGHSLNRLVSDPGICGGSLRVKGTRYTVVAVLRFISTGYEVADIVREFPGLEDADVRQCAKWGAWVTSYRRIDTGDK